MLMFKELRKKINSVFKTQYNSKNIETDEGLYISKGLSNLLNECLAIQDITPEISINLQQINTMIEDLNTYYTEKNWSQVAVNIRKLSDFTKTVYNIGTNTPLKTILTTDKWSHVSSIVDAKNLETIDQKMDMLEEIDSSRDFANAELHPSANARQLVIDLQMLPKQPAINFLVNVAIEGANYQKPKDRDIITAKWENIFTPMKITDRAREELEKPKFKGKVDNKPLDEFCEQQIISDDIVQHLLNGKEIQYIAQTTDVFELLEAFWSYDWANMRKFIKSSLCKPNIKKNTPLAYYQLKLSEAWLLLQLGNMDRAVSI